MSDTPATRQFVAVLFKPWDTRSYTYHNDGPPVAIGDSVLVTTAKGGQQAVTVSALPTEAPSFPTKPIDGLAPDVALDEAEAEAEIHAALNAPRDAA